MAISADDFKVVQSEIEFEKKAACESARLDGDLGGETSDALERYRIVKTEEAQFNLEVKKGLFVERAKYEETLRKAATYMRKYLQNLGKLLGVKLSKEKKAAAITKIIDGEIEGILKRVVEEYTPDD